MGNAMITPCFRSECSTTSSFIKLISYGGATSILTGKHLAGEIMFEFPDRMVCHADSFFIGRPIPSLTIDDELVRGQTYFLLPLDCFTSDVLSASSLAALGSAGRNNNNNNNNNNNRSPPVKLKECPFEYLKGSNGKVLIKVVPEFITRLITRSDGDSISKDDECVNSLLCSTPELQKHYNQLVGCKDQVWSPNLETISEYKIRFSPCRFMGLEWKQGEAEGIEGN